MCRGTGWGLWWAFLVFPGRLALLKTLTGRHKQQKREQSAASEDEEQP